jgi:hypothetical protein
VGYGPTTLPLRHSDVCDIFVILHVIYFAYFIGQPDILFVPALVWYTIGHMLRQIIQLFCSLSKKLKYYSEVLKNSVKYENNVHMRFFLVLGIREILTRK